MGYKFIDSGKCFNHCNCCRRTSCCCGKDGKTPYIGRNGNWWIGCVDTGVRAQGKAGPQGPAGADGVDGLQGPTGADGIDGVDGVDGLPGQDGSAGSTPYIGENGNWWIDVTDTGVQAQGETGPQGPAGADGVDGSQGQDGDAGLTPYIGEDGNWWIDESDTGVPAQGEAGPQGPTGADGLPGQDGSAGLTPYIGENGNWWIGETDTGVQAETQWVDYINQITVDPTTGVTSTLIVASKVANSFFKSDGTTVKFNLMGSVAANQAINALSIQLLIPPSLAAPSRVIYPATIDFTGLPYTMDSFQSAALVFTPTSSTFTANLIFNCTAAQNPKGFQWLASGEYFL